MKGLFSLLGSLVVAFMLMVPGNAVQAEEPGCECHNITMIQGVERNVMVANLLKTDLFKSVKGTNISNGFEFVGADAIEIVKFNLSGKTMVGVAFEKAGVRIMSSFALVNGQYFYLGDAPAGA